MPRKVRELAADLLVIGFTEIGSSAGG